MVNVRSAVWTTHAYKSRETTFRMTVKSTLSLKSLTNHTHSLSLFLRRCWDVIETEADAINNNDYQKKKKKKIKERERDREEEEEKEPCRFFQLRSTACQSSWPKYKQENKQTDKHAHSKRKHWKLFTRLCTDTNPLASHSPSPTPNICRQIISGLEKKKKDDHEKLTHIRLRIFVALKCINYVVFSFLFRAAQTSPL